MAENIRIGFIGFGSMGQAICDGLIRTGTVPPACICASGRNQEKLRDNTQKRGIAACESTAAVVSASDIVLLCVKPEPGGARGGRGGSRGSGAGGRDPF